DTSDRACRPESDARLALRKEAEVERHADPAHPAPRPIPAEADERSVIVEPDASGQIADVVAIVCGIANRDVVADAAASVEPVVVAQDAPEEAQRAPGGVKIDAEGRRIPDEIEVVVDAR